MMGKEQSLEEKDDRYLLYLSVPVVDDTVFPLKYDRSMPVSIHFSNKDCKLIVEE